MNLEEINKWLDNEYGCSYTRLEELHDFYFEMYCDLKKENNQLKDNWNKLKEIVKNQSDFKLKIRNKELWFEVDELLSKMEELEQGSDNNVKD